MKFSMLPGRTEGSNEYCATCERSAPVCSRTKSRRTAPPSSVRIVVLAIARHTDPVAAQLLAAFMALPPSGTKEPSGAAGTPDGFIATRLSRSETTTPAAVRTATDVPEKADVYPSGVVGPRLLLPVTLNGPVARNGSPTENWSFTELKLVWLNRLVPSAMKSHLKPRSRLMKNDFTSRASNA